MSGFRYSYLLVWTVMCSMQQIWRVFDVVNVFNMIFIDAGIHLALLD